MFGKKRKQRSDNKEVVGEETAKEQSSRKNKSDNTPEGRGTPKSRINWKHIIFIVLAVEFAIAAGIGVTLWAIDKWVPEKKVAIDQVEEIEEVLNIENIVLEAESKQPALYYKLRPVFTVGIRDNSGMPRYLQIDLALMLGNEEVIELVETHRSLLRDHLLTLFSKVKYEELYSVEGKERLRSKALQTIQEILAKQTGRGGIESVHFTSLVL